MKERKTQRDLGLAFVNRPANEANHEQKYLVKRNLFINDIKMICCDTMAQCIHMLIQDCCHL